MTRAVEVSLFPELCAGDATVEWEDPPTPAERRTRAKADAEFFAQLRRHPGRWAVYSRDMHLMLTGLRTRWPDIEFAVAPNDGPWPDRGTVYARHRQDERPS